MPTISVTRTTSPLRAIARSPCMHSAISQTEQHGKPAHQNVIKLRLRQTKFQIDSVILPSLQLMRQGNTGNQHFELRNPEKWILK